MVVTYTAFVCAMKNIFCSSIFACLLLLLVLFLSGSGLYRRAAITKGNRKTKVQMENGDNFLNNNQAAIEVKWRRPKWYRLSLGGASCLQPQAPRVADVDCDTFLDCALSGRDCVYTPRTSRGFDLPHGTLTRYRAVRRLHDDPCVINLGYIACSCPPDEV